MQKLLRILLLFVLAGTGCTKEIGEKFTQIDRGKEYLSYGQFREALNEFNSVAQKDPDNCDAAYGILLANTGIGIETLSNLFNTALSLFTQGGTAPVNLASSSEILPEAENPIDSLIESFFIPFLSEFEQVEKSVQKIEGLQCSFYLEHYVVDFRLSNLLRIYVDLRGEWSIVEAKLIGAVFDLINALDYIVLSLDLSINTGPVFRQLLDIAVDLANNPQILDCITSGSDVLGCFSQAGDNIITSPVIRKILSVFQGDFITFLQGIGFIVDQSPNFLQWHPDRYSYFLDVGDEFASALTRIADSLTILFNKTAEVYSSQIDDPYDDIIVFDDGENERRGKADSSDKLYINAYNPLTPDVEKNEDNICYNIFISLMDDDPATLNWCKQSLLNVFVVPIIQNETNRERLVKVFQKWANIFSGADTDSFITADDINDLTLNLLGFPDVIAFKPQVWFTKTPEDFIMDVTPPREWLPHYRDIDDDGYADFLVEGEVFNGSSTYPCGNTYIKYGDCDHFPSDITFSYTSPTNSFDLNIPADCLAPSESLNYIYLASRDPTLGGALYIKLRSEDACSNSVENAHPEVFQDYVLPMDDKEGLYFFNKSLNIFLSSILGILSGGLPF